MSSVSLSASERSGHKPGGEFGKWCSEGKVPFCSSLHSKGIHPWLSRLSNINMLEDAEVADPSQRAIDCVSE